MDRYIKYFTAFVFSLLVGFFISTIKLKPKTDETLKTMVRVKVRTDTIRIKDTIRISKPILVKSIALRKDTIYLSKDVYIDSSKVVIPIEQKIYNDSSYTAFVSGYNAQLDSIHIRSPTTIINREIERTITQTRLKRFNMGFVGGVGYGFMSKSVEPFVGVGIIYTLK
ncbi:hypothetical protein HMPREF0669_00231 (plasmid) [Prevotella sp. oral taxon 299 str. F0039]|nr:hypothetical protein HMPREF0669_00231 [Prevotella sp. oral taxon 299 str. F0039]